LFRMALTPLPQQGCPRRFGSVAGAESALKLSHSIRDRPHRRAWIGKLETNRSISSSVMPSRPPSRPINSTSWPFGPSVRVQVDVAKLGGPQTERVMTLTGSGILVRPRSLQDLQSAFEIHRHCTFNLHASSRCGGEGDGSLHGRRASLPRGAGHWISGPGRLPS
jgi:hypothetical protein